LISVYIDGKQVTVKKLDLKETLDSVRKKLAEKISNSNLFALEGGDKIELSDESGLNLEDILINGKKLYMVTNLNVSSPKPTPPKKNTPLKDAKLIENIGHLKIYQYPNVTLSDIEESRAISLLVVGQTGSGKTTLLNAFINALMDIEITDDFRYKIIIENFNHRMTDSVNIYNIKPQGNLPPIKIIDTPGFGDDRGIAQDKIIRDQIVDTFKKRLNTINAICFVAKSSNARLTADQRYIFTSILDLFGKDVQENFVAMLTFSDGGEPRIVPVLKEEIFDKIIPHIKGNWYYKFNNSAIYSEDVNDMFTQMFWKLGMKSFKGFIQQLVKIPRKSLTQSKEVLKERQSLENSIKNLSNSLQMGLRTMESIRQTLDAIQNANLNINASKGFEVRTKVTVWKTIDAPVGQYTTTCVRCNRTCHENCSYGPGESKEGCCAIGGNGYCTECPGRCHHSIHQNLPILLVSEEKEVVVTDKDLEKRYYDEKSKLSKQAQYINGLKNDFMHITMSCMNIQEQIKNSVDKLKKIALNSNSYESSEDYIDFLIESEKSERKKGYLERIKGLEELKKQHQILREVYKNENSTTKSFEQFKKEFLEKEQNAKKDENCCIF
jgi:GTP-binding protein EngB required for normal cell division